MKFFTEETTMRMGRILALAALSISIVSLPAAAQHPVGPTDAPARFGDVGDYTPGQPQLFAPTASSPSFVQPAFLPPPPQLNPASYGIQATSFLVACDGLCDDGSASSCVGDDCCCEPVWSHRTGIFAEVLYLRARDSEVAYAVPIDGGIVPPPLVPTQVGPVAVADPDYSAGFRVGFNWALDRCSSVRATFTQFESNTFSQSTATAPVALRSLLLHPGTVNAGADFLDANANYSVDFDLIDADFRGVWTAGDRHVLNYLVGLRYARQNQQFRSSFTNVGTTDFVDTNVNFDGVGFRLGVDGERYLRGGRFLVYGSGVVNVVAGEFGASFLQGSTADPVIVNTSWDAGRVITMLDIELGAGWQSECGRLRLTAGYLFSFWYNTVTTDAWIQSVRANNFVDIADTMSFDGLTARVEYRF